MNDETIFAVALEKAGPAERAAYLSEACAADPEQRKRVEGLLAALDVAGKFLERPVVAAENPEDAATRADVGDAVAATGAHPDGTRVGEEDESDALGFLAPSKRPDSLGRIGHYEVLEVLGRGGFGIVFRAFDEVLQRVVAVKVLAPSMAATSPARKRFLREARSSGAVQHENVVRVHAVSRDDEPLPYLVMEFIAGKTLQDRLDRSGPFEVTEVVQIGRQVAEGLAAAHEKGLIHRDIKPSNILVTGSPPHAKITDFGLARAADDASLTRSGTVAGTPLYMAPEQARGEALDHRADLFSLGSVLYVMLTGRPPFRAETTLGVLKRVSEDTPRPIREVIPEVPEWLCRIVEKLHAKEPAERFQTAREVADLLADCEKQLAAHKELRDFSRIPGAPTARPRRQSWGWPLLAVVGSGIALGEFLGFGPASRASERIGEFAQSWLGVMALATLVVAVLAWIVRRNAPARGPVAVAVTKPVRRRHSPAWTAVTVIVLSALFVTGVLFARPALLYATHRGELELLPQDGLVSVIVLQNDEGDLVTDKLHPMVTDWLNMKQSHRLKLSPGKYQLNAGTYPEGTKIPQWEVTTSGPFGKETRLVPGHGELGWSVIVTVERGCRTTVRPVVRQYPVPQSTSGRWVGTALEMGGKFVDTVPNSAEVMLWGERVILDINADNQGDGTYYVNEMVDPKQITIALSGGKGQKLGIYRFDGDQLILCLGDVGAPRPTHFETGPAATAIRLKRRPDLEPGRAELMLVNVDPVMELTVLQRDQVLFDGVHKATAITLAADVPTEVRATVGAGKQLAFKKTFVLTRSERRFLDTGAELAAVEKRNRDAIGNNLKDIGKSMQDFGKGGGWLWPTDQTGRPASPPNPAVVQPLKDAVAAKERTLDIVKKRHESGVATQFEVLGAEAELNAARAALAEAEQNLTVAAERLEDAVKQRKAVRAEIEKRVIAGVDPPSALNGTIERIAEAEVQLARAREKLAAAPAKGAPVEKVANPAIVQPLKDAVAAKERTLHVVKVRHEYGLLSKIELRAAEAELSEARAVLAEAEGDSKSAVARLEDMVKQRQEERDLIAVRVEVGADGPDRLSQADARVATAKALLAKAREKLPTPAPGPEGKKPDVAPVPHPKP